MSALLICFVLATVDGDTLKVDCDGKRESVRIAQIDAPEKNQPHGQLSTMALNRLCINEYAKLIAPKKEKFGRLLADVECKGVNVGKYMVKNGHAWAYMTQDTEFVLATKRAQDQRIGLFSTQEKHVEPSEWRKGVR